MKSRPIITPVIEQNTAGNLLGIEPRLGSAELAVVAKGQ